MKPIPLSDFVAAIPKDLRATARVAHEAGWTFGRMGNGHTAFVPPSGGRLIYVSSSPRDGGVIDAVQRQLWKAGLSIPGTKWQQPQQEGRTVTESNAATTSLGDALASAGVVAEMGPKPPADRPFTAIVLDILQKCVKHYISFDDIIIITKAKRKGAQRSNVSNALFELKRKGLVANPERGVWAITASGRAATAIPIVPKAAPPKAAPTPAAAPAAEDELTVLYELLAAMAKAEPVIRAILTDREKMQKIRELLK